MSGMDEFYPKLERRFPHEIKVGSRCRKDLGDLTGLVESIRRLGMLNPVTIDKENNLIAGERRLEAAKRVGGISVPVLVAATLDDVLKQALAERDENTERKDFAPSEAVAMARRIEPLERAEAKKRQQEAGTKRGRGQIACGNLPQAKARTRDKVGKAVGMSGKTFEMAKAVVSAAEKEPELLGVVKEMDESENVARAFRKVKKREAAKKLDAIAAQSPDALTGSFDVIVVDPPWPIQKFERDCRPNQTVLLDYPTMTLEAIQAFDKVKLHAAENCHVFLWTTQKLLREAFGVLSAWGARYVFSLVWHKPGGPQPLGLPQYNAEFCLYGKIGNPKFADTKDFFTANAWPRRDHSQKPAEFYDLVRRVTAGRRADLFNRGKIPGFVGWGNQAQ